MALNSDFLKLLDSAEKEGDERLAASLNPNYSRYNMFTGIKSHSSIAKTSTMSDQALIGAALRYNVHWQWVCADRYGKFAQTAKYGLYRETSSGVELLDTKHFLYSLIEKPNKQMRRSQLWYLVVHAKHSLGNAFCFKDMNSLGKPATTRFMFPQWGQVRPFVNEFGEVTHYEKEHQGEKKRFEYDEIIHFKYPSINSDAMGRSPGMAIMETHEFDLMMKAFYNNMMQTGGYPAHYFTTDQIMDGTRREELKKAYEDKSSFERAGTAFILDGGLKHENMGFAPKDFESNEFLKMNRDQFMQAYALSKSVMNISDATNRADAEAGIYVTARFGFQPALDDLGEDWTYGLLKYYDDYVFMKFDSVVADDEQAKAQVYKTLIESGLLMPDEGRKDYDRPPYENGIGSVPLVSNGLKTLKNIDNPTKETLK